MCFGCYEAMGAPLIVNEATIRASELVAEVYEEHPNGGAGHIVFDDFNISDEHVQWCIENCLSDMDENTMKALQSFLPLSEDERASALALFEGWVPRSKEARR